MKKQIEALQKAEYELRNLAQANTDELSSLSIIELRLACDLIQNVRHRMKAMLG